MTKESYVVSKWVLINLGENTPNAPTLSAQIVCQSPKVWDFYEKRLHWASVIRDSMHDFGYAAKVKLATIALQ